MKIYGGALSPFVMRPVLAARAKGLDISSDPNFEGGSKSAAYLALNPMGKVPLLVDGDFALPESQVIVDYLDAVLPGPKLVPADPKEAARARLLTRMADVYVVPHLGALFQGRENPAGIAPAKEALAVALANVEHFRQDSDVFLVGDSFSVADAAFIPLFFFFDAFDAGMGTGALIAALPRLAAWWTRAKASPLGGGCVAEQGAALAAFFAAPPA